MDYDLVSFLRTQKRKIILDEQISKFFDVTYYYYSLLMKAYKYDAFYLVTKAIYKCHFKKWFLRKTHQSKMKAGNIKFFLSFPVIEFQALATYFFALY